MATTQLESGFFMVGMDRDCMSASMSEPYVCPHVKPPPPQKKGEKNLYNFLIPGNLNCTYDIYFFDTSVHFDFDKLSGNKQTMDLYFPVIPNVTHSMPTLCSEDIVQCLVPSNQMQLWQNWIMQLVAI